MKNCIQFIIFTLSNTMHKSSKSYMLTWNQLHAIQSALWWRVLVAKLIVLAFLKLAEYPTALKNASLIILMQFDCVLYHFFLALDS